MLIMQIIFLCFFAVFFSHEGGHYIAARCFGKHIKFRFAWGRFYVPRYIWNMPVMEYRKQRIVAAAGFGTEALVAAILAAFGWPWMAVCFAIHFVAYPFYAGEANDFKWLRRE